MTERFFKAAGGYLKLDIIVPTFPEVGISQNMTNGSFERRLPPCSVLTLSTYLCNKKDSEYKQLNWSFTFTQTS